MRYYECMKGYKSLIAWIIGCEAVGWSSSVFTVQSIPTWYAALEKPALNPPNWVFGPVWTTLYALMGISIWLVLSRTKSAKVRGEYLWLFLAQLGFNFLWTLLFFGFRQPMAAFFEIVLLWLLIMACIFRFYASSRLASYLLVPYILWVSFASYLNISIALLNR